MLSLDAITPAGTDFAISSSLIKLSDRVVTDLLQRTTLQVEQENDHSEWALVEQTFPEVQVFGRMFTTRYTTNELVSPRSATIQRISAPQRFTDIADAITNGTFAFR